MTTWNLSGPSEGKYKDEVVRSVFLGKLLHFLEGRNSWWGTWSSTYFNEYSFHPDLGEVQRRIEVDRKQGSHWHIVELPALVFAGERRALVAVEINTTKPFSDVTLSSLVKPTLTGFAELLRPSKRDSIWTFFVTPARIKPAQARFLRYESVSYGRDWRLSWTTVAAKYQLDGVRLLMAAAKRRMKQPSRKSRPKTSRD
jgi:hypothetical protein